MRQNVIAAVCILATAIASNAATVPLYVNSSPVHSPPDTPPTIDATAFANQSIFEVNDTSGSGLPYQTYNTFFFTNMSTAFMYGDVGFRFDHSTGTTRTPMNNWVNSGSITGGVFLLVSAANISNSGRLNTSDRGIIRLTGNNINLSRNGMIAGLAPGASFSGFNATTTNYYDPIGVSDLYWGFGTNNGQNARMSLTSTGNGQPGFDPAFPFTAKHKASVAPLGTTQDKQFGVGFGNAAAYALKTTLSATSSVIQVVFVPTNSAFDSNISTRVFFVQDGIDDGATAVVEFKYRDFDIVNQAFVDNFLYFADSTAFATNITLAKNKSANTSRPNSYELSRSTFPLSFGNGLELSANTPYSPGLIYNPSYTSNSVNVTYAAYGADIAPITVLDPNGRNIWATTDPTNYPGRIEINGDTVNLDQTKIRAESTVMIKANDLSSNKVARIDALYSNFDLRTTQPQMVISNFAPSTVNRLSGQLYAWSATWQNQEVAGGSTNLIEFHVLMLDHSLISTQVALINELALHAPHLVIADPLSVRKSMVLDSRGLDVTGGLTLAPGANWANTNVVELYSFTNRGIINIPQSDFAGTDRANPYDNYINRGTNSAASHQIRTRNFQDSGCLVANVGFVNVQANTASISGGPLVTNVTTNILFVSTGGFFFIPTNQVVTNVVGAKIQASGNIQITSDQLSFSNAFLQTAPSGGAISLSVTGRLSDAGPGAVSYWNTAGGFNLQTQPASGDLFGTYVRTTVPANGDTSHTWCAQDRGATISGFQSNSVLGKLTIDAGSNGVIHFAAATNSPKALYVDYLELLNYATNVNTQLAIDPNFTIYFANANIAASKLDGSAGGRLRWVKSFTGPLSSTNFTYTATNVDGTIISRTYTFNLALVTDQDLNSDGDNLVNAEDPTPIYTSESVGLRVAKTKVLPPQISITWNALRGVTNTVQYRTNLTLGNWTVLTNVVPPGPISGPFSIRDFLPTSGTGTVQRIYRVLVNTPP